MLSVSEIMFGQLRGAQGHIKSIRPSKTNQPNKQNNPTVLPSSFPSQATAYSSSSHFPLSQKRLRLSYKVFMFSYSKSLDLLKNDYFPTSEKKNCAKMKGDVPVTSVC